MKPNWIDLQINGYAGVDFNSRDLSVDGVVEVTSKLAAAGTAGYLPTIITGAPDKVLRNLRVIVAARKKSAECRKRILGVHLEGPFISPVPGCIGAHDPKYVSKPDFNLYRKFQDAADGLVKIMTIAAEIKGAPDLCRALTADGVVVSCGHQAATSGALLERMADSGAKALTHLGNGIPNMIHRRENIIWEGLACDRLSVMFIPDGHHLTTAMLKVYTRAVPLERLVAVTDCSHPGGLKPGRYFALGNHAVLEPDGLLHNPKKGCLVGSTATMQQVVDVLRSPAVGVTAREANVIAHDNPLRLIGLG